MIFLARLLEMFWQKSRRERRQSTPGERAEFEVRRKAEENEREELARRLDYLEAEASLLANEPHRPADEPHLEKRST